MVHPGSPIAQIIAATAQVQEWKWRLFTSKFRYQTTCDMSGTSTPPNHQDHVISRRLCSGWLRPGSASAYVCSGLLAHLTRHRPHFNQGGPEKASSPRQGPQIYPHSTFTTCVSQNSFLGSRPRLSVFMQHAYMRGHFLASYFSYKIEGLNR